MPLVKACDCRMILGLCKTYKGHMTKYSDLILVSDFPSGE
jgi:hypothetical protein